MDGKGLFALCWCLAVHVANLYYFLLTSKNILLYREKYFAMSGKLCIFAPNYFHFNKETE